MKTNLYLVMLVCLLTNNLYCQDERSTFPVIVFQDQAYQGKGLALKEGATYGILPIIGNDQLSSVKVASGWKVILFKDGMDEGEKLELTSNTPNLSSFNFDNVTSNIRVERLAPGTVYAEKNYLGKSLILKEGKTPGILPIVGNDQVSSIKITNGWKVILFKDGMDQGKKVELTSNTPDLCKIKFDNVTSNIRVERLPPVTVYTKKNYLGKSLSLNEGATYGNLPIVGNDNISSVKVASGWKVILFKDNMDKGEKLVLTDNASNLSSHNFDNLTSNIRIEKIQNGYDYNKMIPLSLHPIFATNFSVKLSGSAINAGGSPDMLFDTGSWGIYIPHQYLDSNKIEIINEDVDISWIKGILKSQHPELDIKGDLVRGQLGFTSEDGTEYTIDDFTFHTFYDAKNKANELDYKKVWNICLLGGFPSLNRTAETPSLTYALINKYSKKDMIGMGIVSKSPGGDISSNWSSIKAYLQFGNDPSITQDVRWRSDLPNAYPQLDYCPERIPGFIVEIGFPESAVPPIASQEMTATFDTGSSVLSMPLNAENYRYPPTTQSIIEKSGYKVPLGNYQTTTFFVDDENVAYSYQFSTTENIKDQLPNRIVFSDHWKEKRIFPGNVVFFYCPVVFWDVSNKRFGMAFN